ncbi:MULTISPECIES: PH domain-containing protein [Clostridium]|uniref:PH domain-containing protein n=1 Tax=Clostridium TaxID=1485 RepID=UPI0009EECC76|nr:PH domain-containing protein [Clostridium thermopalmarium]
MLFDFLCFTNKRLIFVDKDLSFKELKTTIVIIPYDKIHGTGLVKNEKVFAFTDELILYTKAKKYALNLILNLAIGLIK